MTKQHWQLAAPGHPELTLPGSVMGIINVTPDSFSDGGAYDTTEAAIAHGLDLLAAGADWLDIGGESSRPGAQAVSAAVEADRVVPVIAGLRAAGVEAPISIDTWKHEVAEQAIAAGVTMVNDITAGRDPELFPLVAGAGVALCLMHMQGEPATMQDAPRYSDVVDEVRSFIDAAMDRAGRAGVPSQALVCDPGIGFGKTNAHNWALLQAVPVLAEHWQRPVLIGVSRKRLVAHLLGGDSEPADRDSASHLLHVQLFATSALVRVHDVAGAVVARRLCLAGGWDAADKE